MIRKFGIELELVAPANVSDPQSHSVRTLEAAGIECRANTHFGRTYSVWQSKPDGSLRPPGRCTEVVSRIMPGNEASYAEVRRAVDALNTAGYGINVSCGFHVHINVADLTFAQRLLVALRYYAISEEINSMMPPSRRSNSFAQNFNAATIRGIASGIRGGLTSYSQSGRYYTTNLNWIGADGGNARIEFRQAAGTCNADKVIGWVKFLQEMIQEVVRRSTGVNFSAAAGDPTQLETTTLPGRAPNMRPGSSLHTLYMQFKKHGEVRTEWAREQGIAPHVLRSLVSGLRKHGAQIETTEFDGVLGYQLPRTLLLKLARRQTIGQGLTDADIFVRTVVRQSAPTPITDPVRLMSYGLYEGLSEETRTWVNQRRAVFQEDVERVA